MKADRKPELIVFAGPNGSGKSTITGPQWVIQPYINADDIQREQGITNLEAAILADELRQQAISERRSFTFETVLSTNLKLDLMRQAKDAGYFIRGYFILTCDPELNVKRVEARVKSGLHDVPRDTVIRRYHSSLANIPEFISLCDVCHIYDNTDKPFRIFRKHKSSMTVFENDFWTIDSVFKLIGR